MQKNPIAEALRQSNSPKDWIEDFSHENGNYLCLCIECDFVFKGHKRRVICAECAARSANTRVCKDTPTKEKS